MHAYQRPDGSYDVYDVEPKVVTAAEYAVIKKLKELNASKESHLAAIAAIDAEVAKLTASASNGSASTVEVAVAPSNENFKRKW